MCLDIIALPCLCWSMTLVYESTNHWKIANKGFSPNSNIN